jgi:hypothetical protein
MELTSEASKRMVAVVRPLRTVRAAVRRDGAAPWRARGRRVVRHYGLDYDSVTLDDDAPAGSAGAGSADQSQAPAGDAQADTTGTLAPESASIPADRLSDPDAGAEPAATNSCQPLDRRGRTGYRWAKA